MTKLPVCHRNFPNPILELPGNGDCMIAALQQLRLWCCWQEHAADAIMPQPSLSCVDWPACVLQLCAGAYQLSGCPHEYVCAPLSASYMAPPCSLLCLSASAVCVCAGAYRLSGSPREYACPSDAEEHAALYNMACCYAQLGQKAAALTCIESILETGMIRWLLVLLIGCCGSGLVLL